MAYLFLSFFIPNSFAQNEGECSTTVSADLYQRMVEAVPHVLAYEAAETPPPIADIPVRITVFRKDDGTGDTKDIDQAVIDAALLRLTDKFSFETFFTFVQCGEINYVNNTFMYEKGYPRMQGNFSNIRASHVSNAANVYITGSTDEANLPCKHYEQNGGNPCVNELETGSDTEVTLAGIGALLGGPQFTFTHEMGHHFGLLHTHGPIEEPEYIYPVQPNQFDHPDPEEGEFPRELVIREDDEDGIKEFPTANWNKAGDLLRDTPPEGRLNNNVAWPGWSMNSCIYNGTYVDYNGDPTASSADYELGSSYMSKAGGCRSVFTSDQGTKINNIYEVEREHQYDLPLCDNWNDKVEFEGSNDGMDRVGIIIDHPGTLKYCNTLTNPDGDFHGVLFGDNLNADVRFLGTGADLAYTYEDWTKGVDVWDLSLLKKLLAVSNPNSPFPANGYTQIAADLNDDGQINSNDVDILEDLILGNLQDLPAHNQPYQFMPEYIPQDFDIQFNDDPFNMTINGVTYANEAPYLEKNWEYSISDGNNGKSGFDGVKLGDIGTKPAPPPPPYPGFTIYFIKVPGENGTIEFDFYADNTIELSAYQLEIGFDTSALNYQTVYAGDLVGVTPDLFGTQQSGNGVIRSVWYNSVITETHTINQSDKLFQLVFDNLGEFEDAEVWLNEVVFNDAMNLEPRASSESNTHLINNFAVDKQGNIVPITLKELNKPAIKAVSVYPNPFNTQLNFNIQSREKTSANILIYNALGQALYESEQKLKKGYNEFGLTNFNDLPSGILFVTIQNEDKIISKKIIKQ